MTAKNDHTGHLIKTGQTSDAYRNNYDLIFGKKVLDSKSKEQYNSSIESLQGKQNENG